MVVANHTLQVRGSADVWMVGRVFNRGLKPARNVRVVPMLTNLYGSRLPTNTFYLNPPDVPPTSFANFEARVGIIDGCSRCDLACDGGVGSMIGLRTNLQTPNG